MGKRTDEEIARRIRSVVEESIRTDEMLRRERARAPNPVEWLRESIIGKTTEVWIFALFSLVGAAFSAFILSWIAGYFLNIDDHLQERVFWAVLALFGALGAANTARNAMAERAIAWARKEEAASSDALSLKRMLEDIDEEFEGAVPDLSAYDDSDIYGDSPIVDAALKGLRLPDRSRPNQDRGAVSNLHRPPAAGIRKEPPVIRRS